MTSKRKLVIDCDVGTDDAQAIIMALAHPDIQVVAITSVFGNSPVDCTSINSLRILKLCDRTDIPVYRGCEKSLIGTPCVSDGFHGNDGLGDVPHLCPADPTLLQKEHSVSALVRLVNENPGEITVVAIGPLTNVAMAIHMDNDFGKKIKEIIIMGGNTTGRGNITLTAEFNFYSDPEAAHVALTCLKNKIIWVPMELCVDNTFSWDWYADFCKLDHPKVKFMVEAEKKMLVNAKNDKNEVNEYPAWDQLAMAIFINRSVVTETKEVHVNVDLHGRETRGQCVIDHKGMKGQPNVTLVTKVDTDLYSKLVIEGHTN